MSNSQNSKFKKYLKAFAWMGQALGVSAPAIGYFVAVAPPLLPRVGLLLPLVCGALAIIAFKHRSSGRGSPVAGESREVVAARRCLALALVAIVLYALLLQWCSVVDPQNERARFQIGFGMTDWSLTPLGLSLKSKYPLFTARDMLLAVAGFHDGGAELLWKVWTVYLAGLLLIVSYLVAFVFWVLGFGFLAKQVSGSPA